MSTTIEILALELLCSRLCHELISPLTAVNNGAELLADDPGDMLEDITRLLSASAGEASRRLQFYRTAYGFAGGPGATIGTTDAAKLMRGLLEGGKVTLDWPDTPALALPREAGKVLLNTMLVGAEALARGGTLTVRLEGEDPVTIDVAAVGEGARLHEETAAALDPEIATASLGPRSIQAFFTARLVRAQGGELRTEAAGPGAVRLTATVPHAKAG